MSAGQSDIAEIVAAAYRRPLEVTYRTLLEVVPSNGKHMLLDRLQAIHLTMESYGLELRSSSNVGDVDAALVLRPHTASVQGHAAVLAEVARGETEQREFKASFQFDLARAAARPDAPFSDLKSTGVRWAALKTVAAFLNSGGGVLYLGVTDSGGCRGVADDLKLLRDGHQDLDGLELTIRDCIKSQFLNGSQVNDYVRTSAVRMPEGAEVLRLEMTSRRSLTFIGDEKKAFHLFRRQGNRTDEVPIQDVEEFLEYRRKLPGL